MTSLEQWLTEYCQLRDYQIEPLPGDASFRRYYRVHCVSGSYMAMDASVEKQTCVPFITIANALRQHQLSAPEIIASDLDKGYLLLTDFGNDLYLKILNTNNAKILYLRALDNLFLMQQCEIPLKPFTQEFMYNELNLFKEWFLLKHLALNLTDEDDALLDKSFKLLSETAANQPYVFMHRDYHSANLMKLPDDKVGILDFQDAFIGPITYDLVSLLRDCYISWPENFVVELVNTYWKKLGLPNVSQEQFLHWFDLMGMQRHLKALLTFSRKYRRDQNASYLQHIPRTLNYLLTVSQRYPECRALHYFLKETVVAKCAG